MHAGSLKVAARGILTTLGGVLKEAGSGGVGVGVFGNWFHGAVRFGLLEEGLSVPKVGGLGQV